MPVGIVKRGNEYCIQEPDGEIIACHPTRQEALDQLIAIELNKALSNIVAAIDDKSEPFVKVVGSSGDNLRLMGLVSSNAYRDREREIIRSDALKEYAEGKTKTKPEQNVLLFWHKGDDIGKVIYAEFYKSFLIEVALELLNDKINIAGIGQRPIITSIKNVWDVVEATSGEWRTSIGFRAPNKSKDGVIYPLDKFETSIVFRDFQANWFTVSEVINNGE
jgi:hypothetical protein